MKGKDVKGRPKGLIARRNSKKFQEMRKKQEEEAQKKATEEEKIKQEQSQGGQQNGVDGKLVESCKCCKIGGLHRRFLPL